MFWFTYYNCLKHVLALNIKWIYFTAWHGLIYGYSNCIFVLTNKNFNPEDLPEFVYNVCAVCNSL